MAAKQPNAQDRMVDSEVAVMGIKSGDGYSALFIIKADAVEDWKRTYGPSYVEVPVFDYRAHFETSDYRKRG